MAEWHDLIVREASALPGFVDKAVEKGTPGGVNPGKKTECKVVLFTSAAGGTGTSTAARAFAECCRRHNRRVLFLDLQTFPDDSADPADGTRRTAFIPLKTWSSPSADAGTRRTPCWSGR